MCGECGDSFAGSFGGSVPTRSGKLWISSEEALQRRDEVRPSYDEAQGRAEWEPRLKQALLAKESAKAQAESFLQRAMVAEDCCADVFQYLVDSVPSDKWPVDRLWDRLCRIAGRSVAR